MTVILELDNGKNKLFSVQSRRLERQKHGDIIRVNGVDFSVCTHNVDGFEGIQIQLGSVFLAVIPDDGGAGANLTKKETDLFWLLPGDRLSNNPEAALNYLLYMTYLQNRIVDIIAK